MTNETSITWEAAVNQLKSAPDQRSLVEACFYDDPLLGAASRYHRSTEWQAVRVLLNQHSGKALDIGSGRGISAFAFARDGWDVTALEPDPSLVVGAGAIRALAQDADLSIEVVEKWGEQLPFSENSFDVVHGRQVLHHARDLPQLCREVARVLRPGGLFIASREHVISRHQDLQVFLDSHPLHRLYGGEHAYLKSEYIAAIRDAGIRLDQSLNPYQSDINAYPDTLAGIKKRIARKLKLPVSNLIPDFVLSLAGELRDTPGRLFTFVGRKPDALS